MRMKARTALAATLAAGLVLGTANAVNATSDEQEESQGGLSITL